MFSKLKYILFDFSDNFKNDYLSLTKKNNHFFSGRNYYVFF